MKKRVENVKGMPEIGSYSNAIKCGNFIFVSGQLPINPQTGTMGKTIQEQTLQVIENIRNILDDAGSSLNDVVKTTVFLSEMCLFSQVNEIYAREFGQPYPARSSCAVKELPQSALVSLDVVAIVND